MSTRVQMKLTPDFDKNLRIVEHEMAMAKRNQAPARDFTQEAKHLMEEATGNLQQILLSNTKPHEYPHAKGSFLTTISESTKEEDSQDEPLVIGSPSNRTKEVSNLLEIP